MIRSFKNKALGMFAENGNAKGLPVQDSAKVKRLISALEAAKDPQQMNVPGLHFHELKGKDKGIYSVRVTGNYRLTFRFDGENAVDVDIGDYH